MRVNGCFCFSLRTGNLILGWLQVISGLIAAGYIIYVIVNIHSIAGKSDPETEKALQDILTILYIALAAVSLGPVFGACHLYGSYTFRSGFLVPYLILGGINLVLFVAMFIFMVVLQPSVLGIAMNLISFAFSFYMYLVVYSFYKKLQEGTYPRNEQA